MKSILIGLLAPALLVGAAASQTIVVPRSFPFAGVPRSLPNPVVGFPLSPARLPAPLVLPQARLDASLPVLVPHPELVVPAPFAAETVLSAPSAAPLPAVTVDAVKELPYDVRHLLPMKLRLALEDKSAAKKQTKAAKTGKAVPNLDFLFDGRRATLPEDDLERELGLR